MECRARLQNCSTFKMQLLLSHPVSCMPNFLAFKDHYRALGAFPGSSADKESACNAGDPGLVLGGEDPPSGEGIGYPVQYFWASLVAQLVKNLPAMLETWV